MLTPKNELELCHLICSKLCKLLMRKDKCVLYILFKTEMENLLSIYTYVNRVCVQKFEHDYISQRKLRKIYILWLTWITLSGE